VLLAEDDREMRRLLVATLLKAGCEVIEAGSGVQLWEAVCSIDVRADDQVVIDLIVSDVRMPGKSGLEVLRALRRTSNLTPVVLITGFGDAETHAEAAQLGALAVFNKPFDMADLRKIVVSLRAALAARVDRVDEEPRVQPALQACLQSTK
jgi:DNA-binding NtrC family response regulator